MSKRKYQRDADARLAAETPTERALRGVRDASQEAMTRIDAARISAFHAAILKAETTKQLEDIRREIATQNVVIRDSLRADWVKRQMELSQS